MAKAEIQITAKDAASRVIGQVKNSLGDLDKRTSALTKTLGGLAGPLASLGGLVSVAGIAAAVKSTADYADGLGKLAQSAGVTSKSMSELAYAANLSGASQEEVAKGLQKIGLDAAQGGKKLGEFGIAVLDNAGNLKASDVLLAEFADRLAAMGSPSERSAAAIALLGEEGAKLVPLLSGGSSALKDMADEAARFGKVVTEDAAKAAAEFNDNLARMTAAADMATRRIGEALIPVLGSVSRAFLTADKYGQGWLETLLMIGRTRAPVEGMSFATVTKDLTEARESLAGLEADRVRYLRANSDTTALDQSIAAAKRNIEYLKDLQRQFVSTDGANQSSAEARRLGLTAPARPPVATSTKTGSKTSRTATPREQVSEAEKYIATLQRQLESVDQLTVKEQLLRDIGMGRLGAMTEAQQRDLLGLAEAIDLRRALTEQEKERAQAEKDAADAANERNQAEQEYIRALLDSTPTGQLELQRAEMERIAQLFLDAKINAEQYLEIVGTKLGTGLQETAKKTDDIAKDLGLSFTSAFEDAVVGGKKFSEVLKGLEADIIRIVTRKLVTEPLGNALSSAIGGFDFGSLFSFDGGGYTGNGARSGGLDGRGGYLAMLHPQETVIDHTKGQGLPGSSRVQNINISVAMPNSGRRETALQFGADVAKQLRIAGMRNG